VIIKHGTVDGKVYVEKVIPRSEIISRMNDTHGPNNWVLMQDGASAHTKLTTMSYLESQCQVLKGWPSNSPDLNPIENLWAIMKSRVADLAPETLESLEDIITDISDDELWHLISSMENRLAECVKANGGPNGY
jgi:transposase